ncbi:(2Fe-2S)-binding protein [Rhodococcus sp. DMU1]|uniref:(2Fe-2S)-binding protein n=1 Tax=Rhodococcus sp. DMU1 TaxID=2722825 RepID=UPI00143EDE21|nr:(2Fe-2S)-binding protein [Rhodococcus sp. DMU1]QIX52711.1 (2Fe-2S)-binding protein [Rhodococcus sp. DMU1]
MYVCLCFAITQRVVAEIVARGARSSKEVANACGAGSDCGRCRRTVRAIIAASGDGDAPRVEEHGRHPIPSRRPVDATPA